MLECAGVVSGRDDLATRQELMEGLQFVPAQAKRVAGMLDAANEWDVKRPAGWSPKEMFAHVSATVGMMPKLGPDILKAPRRPALSMAWTSQSSTSGASPQCARWTVSKRLRRSPRTTASCPIG